MVNIKTNNSTVYIGHNVFDELNAYLSSYENSQIYIMLDENTLEHCVTDLISNCTLLHEAEIIEINSGEENKTLDICYQIWKTLSDFKADRNSLLINLGGGVITDMGGFIASTYKRGIDFINIPTTLLSQIDASVGGKVGVDFEGLKNMVGVFNEPKAVFIRPEFLKTLDKRQMLSGYAEALKHALIEDYNYWEDLKRGMLFNSSDWGALIEKSVTIKNRIVLADPTEKAKRKLLNFGHTIGHAIETNSLNKDDLPLLHGESIAVGIICESYLSHYSNGLSKSALDDISSTILSFYQFKKIDSNVYHHLIELMKHDKKNKGNTINFTLLKKIGAAEVNKEASADMITESFDYFNSLIKK